LTVITLTTIRALDIWVQILNPTCLTFDFVAHLLPKNLKTGFTLEQIMKVQSGIRGTALLFL